MGDIDQNTASRGTTRDGQPGAKAQRTGNNAKREYKPLAEGRADLKAARIMLHKYGVSLWTLESMATTDIFLEIKGRVNVGVSKDDVQDFSAKSKPAKRRILDGIRQAIEAGYMEEFRTQGGTAIDLTDKGRAVLRDYRVMYEKIISDWETKSSAIELEPLTPRMEARKHRHKSAA